MTTPAGAGRGGNTASSGRGRGRGGRSRGGRGRERSNGRNTSNKGRGGGSGGDDNNAKDGGDLSGKTAGRARNGRGGRRQRHLSAGGRGGGGGRGSPADADAGATNNAPLKDPPPKRNGMQERVRKMSDQDILIAFGPFLRSGDPEAKAIHQEYLSNSRQREFIQSARNFLVDCESRPKVEAPPPAEVRQKVEAVPTENKPKMEDARDINGYDSHGHVDNKAVNGRTKTAPPDVMDPEIVESAESLLALAPPPMPSRPPGMPPPMKPVETMVGHSNNSSNDNTIGHSIFPNQPPPGMGSILPQNPVSPLSRGPPPGMPPPMRPPTFEVLGGKTSPVKNPTAMGAVALPPAPKNPTSFILPARTPMATLKSSADTNDKTTAATPTKPARVRRIQTRCEEQPGRLFANDVPAAPFNQNPNREASLTARPRSKLTARWVLPLPYLRNRAIRRFEAQKLQDGNPPQNLTIRDALKHLTVGLFRRGATDSGSQSSIVSKEILAPDDAGEGNHAGERRQGGRPSEDYFFNVDQSADSVFGTVPFYAPRTPGNVLFRLYFDDEPHITLATGPCIHVVPSDGDVDSVLRFILTNFKSKKTNGISSMNSLASVLELISPRAHPQQQKNGNDGSRFFDGAGRVAWGCICESRKAVLHAGQAYVKRRKELEEKIEAELEAEKIKEGLPDLKSLGVEGVAEEILETGESAAIDDVKNGTAHTNKEEKDISTSDPKAKWMSEKFSIERKWREMQLVYASVLKAAVTNNANQLLLKKDILSKLRLEYDLWCPLTEAFAPNPFVNTNDELSSLPGDITFYPHTVTKGHEKMCQESRNKMQKQLLGFVPEDRSSLTAAMRRRKHKQTNVSVEKRRDLFQELSSAMSDIYREEYAVSNDVWKRREKVRCTIENAVLESGEFPPGTKVAVFGSSANGFGSPDSDLDLCLQLPPTATDMHGVEAMANLATKLTEEAGFLNVDTVRLTARIPIVKFNVPYKVDGEEDILVECDLSLQNPLACLNTSLLHTYSKISPSTRILASIIKRWAKARNINTPSQHTLSSYGYVIMLIHFLISCDLGKHANGARVGSAVVNSILPNLQWVDPIWARNPSDAGGPYREIAAKPKNQHSMARHPTEPNYYINTYFYGSGLEGLALYCSENHDAERGLGALLASFFHYYAYDFDYKKYIVSLNTKHNAPPMEREIKAEEDGWSLFRHSLAIEDPFELFYDVAHVVKASNFQHIRKEFCLAFTKIVDSACPNGDFLSGREVIDFICEPVASGDENNVS